MFAPQPFAKPVLMYEDIGEDDVYILAYEADIVAYFESVVLAIPTLALVPMCPPPPPTFSCDKCIFICATQQGLSKHGEHRHSEEKVESLVPSIDKKKQSWPCPRCSYGSISRGDLMKHKKQEHPNSYPHACPSCHYAATKKHQLTRHIRECHQLHKPFHCHYCTYASARSNALRTHEEKIHFDELLFELV